MERMDDSHIPDEVLERCVVEGFPEDRPEITNHLIECDACNGIYEAELRFRDMYVQAVATRPAPQPQAGAFASPTPVWAATGALLFLIFMTPEAQRGSHPAQVLDVAAFRGGQAVHARPGVPLVLRLDTTGLDVPPSVQIAVVNERGRPVWSGAAQQVDSFWRAETPRGLRPGRYWVRIPDPSRPGEVLREFQLDVQ